MIPPPTPVLIAILANLPVLAESIGDRVSTELHAQLPALRVTKVGDAESPSTREWASVMYQIEVWAVDDVQAERIAWDLANHWTRAKRETVRPADSPAALVTGRWMIANPAPTSASDDDAEDTGLSRYLITVAFRLSGAPS